MLVSCFAAQYPGLTRLGLVALGVSALAVSGHAQPFQNGSFENGSFVDNTGDDTDRLSTGSTAMTGWTVVNNEVAWIGPSNPFGLTADDGSYFLDLTSYHSSPPWGGVEQTVTTVSGDNYALSFAIGNSPQFNGIDDPAIVASATGNTALTYVNGNTGVNNNWESFTYDFTAGSASTTLELLGGPNQGSLNYIGLDGVTLTNLGPSSSVPDAASSVGLLSLGLAALAQFGKRR